MKMNILKLALVSTLTFAPAVLLAQATAPAPQTTPTPGKNDYNVNQRKADQQGRIAQGDRSGQLTPGETTHLENQEHGINKEEKGMRAQDNGKLTKQDRQTLHKQQNQESRRIYRDKHNAKVN
jgi:hypothetical protein